MSSQRRALSNIPLYIALTFCLSLFFTPRALYALEGDNTANPARNTSFIELNEDNLLVVEALAGKIPLVDSLFVYQTPDTTMIPLQGLFEALDFPMAIDIDAQTVDGWFISEANRFSLDLYNQTLFIRDIKRDFPDTFLFSFDDFDLYVDFQTLEQWFGLTLTLNVSQLRLAISSEEPLPIIQQLEREAKRKQIQNTKKSLLPENYIANEYDWIGHPAFDIELSLDAERIKESSKYSVNHSNSTVIQGGMDLAKHSMKTSYVNSDGETEVRLSFSKAAREPDKYMFLGLSNYRLGDLTSHSSPLLFSSAKGSGAHLKRGSSTILDQSGTILFEGDAPPGWEVELYRNGSLVGFSTATNKGQFIFNEVSTFVGENIFDIRIYGPQGQYRTERRQISVGEGMIKPGTFEYEVYALNRNQNLISPTKNDNESGTPFLLSEVSYGLTESATLQLGANQHTPLDSTEEHRYIYFNALGSLAGSLAQLSFAQDMEQGNALSTSMKGRFDNTNFNLQLNKYNQLISDQNASGSLDLEAELRFNGVTRAITQSPLTYDLDISHTRFQAPDYQQLNVTKRLSSSWARTLFAHELRYLHSSIKDVEDQLQSTLAATRRWHNWRFKTATDYQIKPIGKFEGASFGATYQQSKAFTYQTTLDYRVSDGSEFSFNNTLSWNLRKATLSVSAGLSSENRQFLGLNLSTSLGYDPIRKRALFTRANLSSSASVTAHTFIDSNNNQEHDAGEESLSGVTFEGRSEWRNQPTDSSGLTTLTGIPELELQVIKVDERSFDDPFLKAGEAQQYIYTHSAKHTHVQFPVLPMLEIEGELIISSNKGDHPAYGCKLSLISEDGEIAFRTTAEYDGIFIFDQVLPGKYRLEIDANYLDKHELQSVPTIHINAIDQDNIIYFDPIILSAR